MTKNLIALSLAATLAVCVARPARADVPLDAGAPVALHDAGSGSQSASSPVIVTIPPASGIHDPAENPLAAWSDAKAAKSAGWAVLVLCVVLMLTKALAYSEAKLQNVPVLGAAAVWLAAGKHAVYVAGAGAICAAAYDVLVNAGSWTAALFAAVGALLAQTHSTTVTPAAKTS